MPYNENIDARIGKVTSRWKNTDRKKMFGGICRLIKGNMFCGVYKDYLILRLGEETAEKALSLTHTKPFDITGKPMKGWVMVAQDGFKTDDVLKDWLNQAKGFAKSLPPK